MPDMRQTKPLGHEHLDTLTPQFARCIPKEVARLPVGNHYRARLIDDEHGIRRAIENALQKLCGQHGSGNGSVRQVGRLSERTRALI